MACPTNSAIARADQRTWRDSTDPVVLRGRLVSLVDEGLRQLLGKALLVA